MEVKETEKGLTIEEEVNAGRNPGRNFPKREGEDAGVFLRKGGRWSFSTETKKKKPTMTGRRRKSVSVEKRGFSKRGGGSGVILVGGKGRRPVKT